jgi:hypothetical protein
MAVSDHLMSVSWCISLSKALQSAVRNWRLQLQKHDQSFEFIGKCILFQWSQCIFEVHESQAIHTPVELRTGKRCGDKVIGYERDSNLGSFDPGPIVLTSRPQISTPWLEIMLKMLAMIYVLLSVPTGGETVIICGVREPYWILELSSSGNWLPYPPPGWLPWYSLSLWPWHRSEGEDIESSITVEMTAAISVADNSYL